jgi:ribose-phosphate pyrophosphokinase
MHDERRNENLQPPRKGGARSGFADNSGMRPTGYGDLKVFSGSAHPHLAGEIAEFLGVQLGQCRLRRFPDSEVSFQIDENIRGTDVFIVQPTSNPVDMHLMELLIMVDAFRRSSASRITAVIPYYGYARQDRKDKPRVPISAKLVANVLSASGVNRVLTMDLHKAQIQGFFDIPVDHLFAAPVIIDYLSRQDFPLLTIVAPDAGGAERARAYAKRLGAELAVIDKRRSDDGTAEVMNVIGEVDGRTCVIADDIIDTAGTIQKAAQALIDAGAERVLACAVHGVLSGPALERIDKAPLERMIVTNTVPLQDKKVRNSKIIELSVARLLGQAIRSIHEETSVSSLFV